MNVSAHFEILQDVIHEIPVKEFIRHHQHVLNLGSRINKIFKFIIFEEYLLLSFLLCVLDFQIVVNEDKAKAIPGLFHVMASVTELLIFSYGGQKVMDSARDVCKNSYDPEHYFIIMKTNQDLKFEFLTFHASLPTFTDVINRTMSLIALMESFL